MLAVAANERSAAGSGVHVVRVKLSAFAIGAFIAGLGGALLAYKQGNVTFDSFTILVGLALFATVYLAGITSVSGGVLAGMLAATGLVFVAMQRWLSLGDWYATITGVLLVLTVIRNPEGIVGPVHAAAGAPIGRRRHRPDPRARRSACRRAARRERGGDRRCRYASVTRALRRRRRGRWRQLRRAGRRTIVGLIGPNGAGKTTLLDALTGFADCDRDPSPSAGGASTGSRPTSECAPAWAARSNTSRSTTTCRSSRTSRSVALDAAPPISARCSSCVDLADDARPLGG